jgi:hypothetical protein
MTIRRVKIAPIGQWAVTANAKNINNGALFTNNGLMKYKLPKKLGVI